MEPISEGEPAGATPSGGRNYCGKD